MYKPLEDEIKQLKNKIKQLATFIKMYTLALGQL